VVMPTIEENRSLWSERYRWSDAGEEWSEAWGGAESQWYGTLFPRVHAFLPASTILEIAPGFGRWTHFLGKHCERLIGVDLSEPCVEECRRRFAARPNTEFHVNDGTSLAMIPDHSVDFVFSCDSLVHAEQDVLAAYLWQLARKLTLNGVGIIHHSNLGAYVDRSTGDLPPWLENKGWRAKTMTAKKFREQCETAGLVCVGQEIVNWWGAVLSDCFSVFTLPRSRWARPYRVVVNHRFLEEANVLARTNQLYTASSFQKSDPAAIAVMRIFNWARQAAHRDGALGAALTSAKRLPLVRTWYRWWKERVGFKPSEES
jgi:Methyltransferase domain